jgi:hypothetical protein
LIPILDKELKKILYVTKMMYSFGINLALGSKVWGPVFELVQKIVKAKEYLSPCGRGRRAAAGEGFFSSQCSVFKAAFSVFLYTKHCILSTGEPLTRPFRATSPTRGEVIILLKNQFCFLNRFFLKDDAEGQEVSHSLFFSYISHLTFIEYYIGLMRQIFFHSLLPFPLNSLGAVKLK